MKKLLRSNHDRKLAGICGGIGNYFGMDSTVVRIVFLLLIIPLNAGIILAYLIGMFVIPNEAEVSS
ncbi:hypothetical protein CR203_07930 [Salipaludibacillus neizhouensis]|uniref:Phage shock protein PspC N-terminal domain-containing protein n=1 Tax=Salipaludibacillus neizhouensis TaxID=885475 RepID=A0A3A9K774_9BACI|nr:PspC domain-containing protein [Salipaludibacillus neizhouensis]RKL68397.1 hypothetical protein CR203_07930 [Salipaludibacillus neizhouensis]